MAEYRAKTAPILPIYGKRGWSARSTAWQRSKRSPRRSTRSSTARPAHVRIMRSHRANRGAGIDADPGAGRGAARLAAPASAEWSSAPQQRLRAPPHRRPACSRRRRPSPPSAGRDVVVEGPYLFGRRRAAVARLSPGGCFCERLEAAAGSSICASTYVQPGERVVLTGGLGPLLFEATSGVMDVRSRARRRFAARHQLSRRRLRQGDAAEMAPGSTRCCASRSSGLRV